MGHLCVRNALFFIPGTTALPQIMRELAGLPYEKIVPPRLHKRVVAALRLTMTRDGEREIPVIAGSVFNVVVTNTEKIRIQKETIRRADLGGLFNRAQEDEARADVANARLLKIASLPSLAIFSDEAHHTYGQSLETGLKKVRKTVDYLAANGKGLVCVVNTTGTPYFRRQMLRDVVVWYGLSEGIRDGILKHVAGNIQSFDFGGNAEQYVAHVVKDFFQTYGALRLPSGETAKIAMYFPQADDLRNLRPAVDRALAAAGQAPTCVLVNTSDDTLTRAEDVAAFDRLNRPGAVHRVILLVNKGTEGWDCPSLFACALVRRLRNANNFVLQAATRCLRKISGVDQPARIYLSQDNVAVLDRQLQETYGESIEALNRAPADMRSRRIVLHKVGIPPLVVRRQVRTVVRRPVAHRAIVLTRPAASGASTMRKAVLEFFPRPGTGKLLTEVAGEELAIAAPAFDAYAAAVELASRYRLDVSQAYDQIRGLYGASDVPASDLLALGEQIEAQTRNYETRNETVEVALALVKPGGFERTVGEGGQDVYTAEIVYPKDREAYILDRQRLAAQARSGLGFHYEPYGFDSAPEMDLFQQLLRELNLNPSEVEDVYFTGALTTPDKTDFRVEYKDAAGRWRHYTPDFVIRRKPAAGERPGMGRTIIIEVKADRERSDLDDGETGTKAMAIRRWVGLNPEHLRYEMVFSSGSAVGADRVREICDALYNGHDGTGAARAAAAQPRIPLDHARLAEVCRRWRIVKLELFGSVLCDDFGPESDVDVLVTFAADTCWSSLELVDAKEDLERLFGRAVDLVERDALENPYRRHEILTTAVTVYAA